MATLGYRAEVFNSLSGRQTKQYVTLVVIRRSHR